MQFESESGIRINNPSEGDLDEYLGELEGVDNSYAYLTAPDGSYVQVGGGPSEFTVELREIKPDGTFRHLKARRAETNPAERHLNIGGASVSVRADQVLDLDTVRKIFRSFRTDKKIDASLKWRDITEMFQASAKE